MKTFILFIFCFLTALCSFSQNSSVVVEQQKYQQLLAQSTKTLVINTVNFSSSTLTTFQNEILAWQGKISSAVIDTNTNKMTIIHFRVLETRELFDVLDKYSIKKSRILSYQ